MSIEPANPLHLGSGRLGSGSAESAVRLLATADADPNQLTPAMRQYVDQKKTVGDAVLLFRMGDFYETFFEDAALCARVLGIALTTRDRSENPVPMAGIPHHALESYLLKLVQAGYRVAISEQLEDARSAKGLIRRDITRIVTPGTLTDDTLLARTRSNAIAALCVQGEEVGVAVAELSGGSFEVLTANRQTTVDELVRIAPAEILTDESGPAAEIARQVALHAPLSCTRRPPHEFSRHNAERTLHEHFGVATMSGFGFDEVGAALCAAGALLRYLRETQRSAVAHLTTLTRRDSADHVQLDRNTWRALEIDRTLRAGSREGSLLDSVDRTATAMGARRLGRWLAFPLRDPAAITARHDAVGYLRDEDAVRRRIRDALRTCADVERIAARISLARATPRDLVALGRTLTTAPAIVETVGTHPPRILGDAARRLGGFAGLTELLVKSIREDAPVGLREGGIIAEGFHPELDRLRTLAREGQSWLAEYQRRLIEETGIDRLKVGFNQVFGYYIEISHAQKGRIPANFVRRQTVKNAERYITEELKRFEDDILTARDRANELEHQLFEEVRRDVAAETSRLLQFADALAELDVLCGLAELAVERRYVRPRLVESRRLEVRDGRHPVLDQTLDDHFVPNDVVLGEPDARLIVLTGPNMAGKSTYIRQAALLVLLAQSGSFVPASAMTFSPVDCVFARVGASDEILRGHSTFMIEMIEAANILRNASPRSLVVLDEIGRGTSTFDGLSLAWAITEHLAKQTQCLTLVATHYHELTELAELIPGIRNFRVAVQEVGVTTLSSSASQAVGDKGDGLGGDAGGVIFLHRIVEGGADKSYGVHVARLAGVPTPVIRRSIEILDELQRGFERKSTHPRRAGDHSLPSAQLSLFPDPADEVLRVLKELRPDELTPLDALKLLSDLKTRFGA
ncbi:MAG: DNA mismatch repair protein MutS [Phycisphaerae bacterium]|nr:DNA mismatch repair protein MutS [Phycisphaerae bacterium]